MLWDRYPILPLLHMSSKVMQLDYNRMIRLDVMVSRASMQSYTFTAEIKIKYILACYSLYIEHASRMAGIGPHHWALSLPL